MNRNYFFCLLGISIIFIMTSCNLGRHYRTESTHFLGIDDKGDIAASVGGDIFDHNVFSSSEKYYKIQGAYSPKKHLAFSGAFSSLTEPAIWNNIVNGFDVDLAVGAYATLDLDQMDVNLIGNEKLVFDAYLSYGWGRLTRANSNVFENSLYYNRYAIQLGTHYENNFGNKLNYVFRVGFVYKPSLLEFTKFDLIGETTNRDLALATVLVEDNVRFMHEFAFQMQFGVKKYQFFFNGNGSSFPTTGSLGNTNFYQIGVLFNINEFVKS